MSDIRKELAASADDAVEVLLQQAAPRLSPPIVDERLVREAVRAEWQAVTGRRNVRRRIGHFAIAATVLLATEDEAQATGGWLSLAGCVAFLVLACFAARRAADVDNRTAIAVLFGMAGILPAIFF